MVLKWEIISVNSKLKTSDRPSKNIVYPIALILLVICGYFNIRRKE